ncbi:MAG: SDR family NAD(P)-dependent oxidoreductase, partial [Thermodesulfovibrionia bacterium]|nr:SDR family NAD(P)-dependent oxidoreductase [Thermodesulfovibrionia bacterium]
MKEQFSIKNKVCIITGAGKGIGRETARLFYGEETLLALITRDKSDLNSLKKETGFDDNRVLLYDGDVSDEETVKRFVEETINKFGKIDVLINNAGMRFRKIFLDITTEEWNRVINTNLNSIYFFCREA